MTQDRLIVPATSCHVLVERTINHHPTAGSSEIRAFVTCRNELLRLPAFLKHYRGIGVDQFFIVDNNSSDGTAEYLADQADVHVFRTANRYREARSGTDWLNALLAEFGAGSWCVTVDVDELLLYPGSEHASLRTLTEYLDHNGDEALSCLLLDLYPPGPLSQCQYKVGDNLLTAAPYFDAGPYKQSTVDLCPGFLITGGMRERVFFPKFKSRSVGAKIYAGMCYHAALRIPLLHEMPWIRASRRRYPPCLTKVPLVRWDKQSKYVYSTHFVSRKTVARETGVLLHFKFLQDFHARAVQEVARGEHYDGAHEYHIYAERLSQNPDMTLMYEGSTRFEGTTQLVRLRLMQETDAWADARVTRR